MTAFVILRLVGLGRVMPTLRTRKHLGITYVTLENMINMLRLVGH